MEMADKSLLRKSSKIIWVGEVGDRPPNQKDVTPIKETPTVCVLDTFLKVIKNEKSDSRGLISNASSSSQTSTFNFYALNEKKQGIQNLIPMQMNQFTLRFSTPDLEERFKSDLISGSQRRIRVGLGIIFLFEILIGLLDILKYDNINLTNQTVNFIIITRYAIVCPILLILGGLSFASFFKKHVQLILSFSSFIVLSLFFVQLCITLIDAKSVYPYGIYYLTHSILFLVYQFFWSGLLFPYATTSFAIFIFMYIIICILLLPDIVGTMSILVAFIIVSAVLAVATYSSENFIRKRWMLKQTVEQEREKIEVEKKLSESLLLNIFPREIAQKFKRNKEGIAEEFESVTIFFSDIVGFTPLAASKSPHQLVSLLNELFSILDSICAKYNVEKIKTIGDAYMAVAGLPSRTLTHPYAVANMAIDVVKAIERFNEKNAHLNQELKIRIGIHTGPCIAGVIGKIKYVYDLFGDTVKIASQMESTGVPGKIQISSTTAQLLRNSFHIQERGTVELRTYGQAKTYFLIDRQHTDILHPPFNLPPLAGSFLQQSVSMVKKLPPKTNESNFSIGVENPHWKWLSQEIEELSRARLSRWSLKFDLPTAETHYFENAFHRNLTAFRVGTIINVLLLLITEDNFVFRQSLKGSLFLAGNIIRFGVLVTSWLGLLLCSFWHKHFLTHHQRLIAIAAFLNGAAIITLGYWGNQLWFGLIGLYLSCFFLVKLSFVNATIVGALLQIIFIIVAFVSGELDMLENVVFISSVLLASLGSSYYLETYARKNFLDEQILLKEQERLNIEQSKSEELLVNLLPVSIANQLKTMNTGQRTIASRFEEVSIIFVHIAGTTKLMHNLGLKELFNNVNKIFCKFDEFTQSRGLEKIKTFGSTYMVAGNLPEPLPRHVNLMIDLALDMLDFVGKYSKQSGHSFGIRIGLNVGPVVAGVIGTKKFSYDLWGDATNVASRMESTGTPGALHANDSVRPFVDMQKYTLEERGEVEVKGKGKLTTFFIKRKIVEKHSLPDVINNSGL